MSLLTGREKSSIWAGGLYVDRLGLIGETVHLPSLERNRGQQMLLPVVLRPATCKLDQRELRQGTVTAHDAPNAYSESENGQRDGHSSRTSTRSRWQ